MPNHFLLQLKVAVSMEWDGAMNSEKLKILLLMTIKTSATRGWVKSEWKSR